MFARVPQTTPGQVASGQTVSQLHDCQWGWCRAVFDTKKDLAHHVVVEHVRTAVPVRRGEIALLRRAEQGVGESLSMGMSMGVTLDSSRGDTGDGLVDSQKQANPPTPSSPKDLPSSLPSPPATSPLSQSPSQTSLPISIPFLDIEVPDASPFSSHPNPHVHPIAVPVSPIPSPTTPPRISCPDPLFATPDTPMNSKRHGHGISTPTFASLSSPLGSSDVDVPRLRLPDSPSLDTLLRDAISSGSGRGGSGRGGGGSGSGGSGSGSGKSGSASGSASGTATGNGTGSTTRRKPRLLPSSPSPSPNHSLNHTRLFSNHRRFQYRYKSDDSTASSSGSREFVETQLTQSLGMDDDGDDEIDDTTEMDVEMDVEVGGSMLNTTDRKNDRNGTLDISPKDSHSHSQSHGPEKALHVASTSQSQIQTQTPAERVPLLPQTQPQTQPRTQSQPRTQPQTHSHSETHTLSTNASFTMPVPPSTNGHGNASLVSPSLQKPSFSIPVPPRPTRQAWYQPSLPRSYTSSQSHSSGSQKRKASSSMPVSTTGKQLRELPTSFHSQSQPHSQPNSQSQSHSQSQPHSQTQSYPQPHSQNGIGNGTGNGNGPFVHTKDDHTSAFGDIGSQEQNRASQQARSRTPCTFDPDPDTSSESVHSAFNPYALQTQAPYASQSWSQSQSRSQ